MLSIILIALIVWNTYLTIMINRLTNKKKTVTCQKCGSEQISTIKDNANNCNRIINVCQNCGDSWELNITQ